MVVGDWGRRRGVFVCQISVAAVPPEERQCFGGDSTRIQGVPGCLLCKRRKVLLCLSIAGVLFFEDVEGCSGGASSILAAKKRVSLVYRGDGARDYSMLSRGPS
jgi:hypothetical protein